MWLLIALSLAHADRTTCGADDVMCMQQAGLSGAALMSRAAHAEVGELVALADETGLDEFVADRIVAHGEATAQPRALALLHLVAARRSAQTGDWQGAVDEARLVPFERARWFEARLLIAEGLHRLGRPSEAVHAARDVLVPPDGTKAPRALPWDRDPGLRARAMARIASVYEDLGDKQTAESFWRSTPLHPRVQADRWVGLARTVSTDGEALGLRVTLADPELSVHTWDPEGPVAWAQALAARCRTREAGLQRTMALRRSAAIVQSLGALAEADQVDDAELQAIHPGLVGWLGERPEVRRVSRQVRLIEPELLVAPAPLRIELQAELERATQRAHVARRAGLVAAQARAEAALSRARDLDVSAVPHREEPRPIWARGLPSRFHGEYWPDEHGRHLVRLRDDCTSTGRDQLLVYP